MNITNLYYHLPIFCQNLMTTLQGYIYKSQRYGKIYKLAINEYLTRDYSNIDFLIEYQWSRINELLSYAYNNSPFYKEFYSQINIQEVIKNRNITLLPILSKEIVRQNINNMYTLSPENAYETNTSGTTGKSIRFLYRKDDIERKLAYLDAFKIKHGYYPQKMRRASFASPKIIAPWQKSKIYWRDNWAIKQRLYSGYHCKGDDVKYFIDNLNDFKPQSMDGYPSAFYEMAQYMLQHNVKLNFKPIAIFPTAETLLPHYRKAIEEAFQCPVRDQYASSEGAPFIVECECGKLHYCMDTGLIEFCDDGRMLVTCFETHGTPLIRYDIGDKATLSTEKCECGSCQPVISSLEGRTGDFVYSSSGKKITSVYLSLVSADFSNSMKAMQFVQNDIHSIDVYIETDNNYQKSMDEIIIKKLHYSMGDNVDVRIHKVNEIEKDKSGKFRFIINNVNKS